jgi:hypothetical protein
MYSELGRDFRRYLGSTVQTETFEMQVLVAVAIYLKKSIKRIKCLQQ